jgi:hypothetical protein
MISIDMQQEINTLKASLQGVRIMEQIQDTVMWVRENEGFTVKSQYKFLLEAAYKFLLEAAYITSSLHNI